jgi:hypothetical protein
MDGKVPPPLACAGFEGGFNVQDRFVYLPLGAEEGMVKAWQETMLAFFLGKGLVDQAIGASLRSMRLPPTGLQCRKRNPATDQERPGSFGPYVVRGNRVFMGGSLTSTRLFRK